VDVQALAAQYSLFVQGTAIFRKRYLSRNPVTGLLIAEDDHILFEYYQYASTDRDRFSSGSMVKSTTGLLIGIAISGGAIKSVDDVTEAYAPGFKGTEYGKTPIRDLLHMSSGVELGEAEYGGRRPRSFMDRHASVVSVGRAVRIVMTTMSELGHELPSRMCQLHRRCSSDSCRPQAKP